MIRRTSAGVDNVSVLTDCLFQAYFQKNMGIPSSSEKTLHICDIFLFGKCRVLHIKLKNT